ncbi:YdeI/OmpD-associated family protein [Roseateles cellulosilyticus]|uniref:YdeI/OmpD-associated family protein n=1 Tax=Pelomonas cellulosilytica TaxID=2906762 RepID=A0ABS8Y1I9_9BURK|nr:YdeI/OmpD-associated family protein [Pelomonas sp. P8]MCE4556906.1 YdeI/OmpD-associated family protein [Pelomonas sp. P8]
MAPILVNPDKVREFVDEASFEAWLTAHHDREDEVWIKMHKVGSGRPCISQKQAIDVVLCWGWIDGLRKRLDEDSFLLRFTPRRPRSVWSQVNVANVVRLVAAGRMTPHGLREVEAAKADGRWARAYAAGEGMKIPDDLQAAIDAEPAARDMLARLNAKNRFALAFRVHHMKTEAGRRRKIATFVEMLKRGETIYPQKL